MEYLIFVLIIILGVIRARASPSEKEKFRQKDREVRESMFYEEFPCNKWYRSSNEDAFDYSCSSSPLNTRHGHDD